MSGSKSIALSIASVDLVTKVFTYFLHERFWIWADRLSGRRRALRAQRHGIFVPLPAMDSEGYSLVLPPPL